MSQLSTCVSYLERVVNQRRGESLFVWKIWIVCFHSDVRNNGLLSVMSVTFLSHSLDGVVTSFRITLLTTPQMPKIMLSFQATNRNRVSSMRKIELLKCAGLHNFSHTSLLLTSNWFFKKQNLSLKAVEVELSNYLELFEKGLECNLLPIR